MAKRLNSVLGIDIGSRTIKVAEMRFHGRQPVVTALGYGDTPEGAVDQMQIYDGDAVAETIKKICAEIGATIPDVVASVAGQKSVLVRVVSDVPADIKDDELRQHMEWEKERSNPFNEDVEMSYQRLEGTNVAPDKAQVLIALAPKTSVRGIVALVKKAGKKAYAIDVEALSLARDLAVGYESELQHKAVCVVDIGHLSTGINIYKDSYLQMPRQVPMGGDMFTRALADGLQITTQEAEALKEESLTIPEGAASGPGLNPFDINAPATGMNPFDSGTTGGETQQFQPYNPFADPNEPVNPFAEPGAEEVAAVPPPGELAVPETASPVPSEDPVATQRFNAIAGVLDQLVEEIRRSVDYYRSQGGSVDLIYLAGGGSKIPGLAAFLERSLGMDTMLLDPLKGLDFQPKKPDALNGSSGKQEFAVAVGNCLHVMF